MTNAFVVQDPVQGSELEDLFSDAPDDNTPLAAEPVAPAPAETTPNESTEPLHAAAVEPQAVATPEESFVVTAKTGSRYKTMEAVVKGIEDKDVLIAEQRQRLAELEAKVGLQAQGQKQTVATQETQQVPDNYLSNPKKLYDDLTAAQIAQDPVAWANTLNKAMEERIQATLGAYAPVMENLTKDQTLQALATDPDLAGIDLRAVTSSPEFKATVERFPLMKNALESAPRDPRTVEALKELVKISVLAYQGLQAPERIKQAATAPTSARPTATQPRPSLTPNAIPPPSTPTRVASLHNDSGRDEIIRKFEEGGLLDIPVGRW